MNTRIRASVQAMADDDILQLVPARILRDIKHDDPHPLFKAFVIGGEGIWQPRIVGLGQTIQNWFRGAVQALVSKLNLGTKVFSGHEASNAHAGRTTIGEVVAKTIEHVRDRIQAVAVAYIYPQFKDMPFDVASIEADVNVPTDAREFEVDEPDVIAVTGIALGNSRTDKPAFPGATLQAALQAFAETNRQGGETMMTAAEIQKAIREAKLQLSDLYSPKELLADPSIEELMQETTPAKSEFVRLRQEHKESERKLRDAEAKIEKVEAEKKDLGEKVETFNRQGLKAKGKEVLAGILKERKLDVDEKFKRFLDRGYEREFKSADEASLRKDLDKFTDAQVDEYKELFSVPGQGGGNDKGGAGGTGANSGTPNPDEKDLTNPKNNDFIPA